MTDDGYGIAYEDAATFFSKLGGSWKRERKRTRHEKRILHGEDGKGRFRALALGRVANWYIRVPSTADPEAPLVEYTVSIIRDRPRQATISDFQPVSQSVKRGVEVVVSELFKQWQIEGSAEVLNELTEIFALYLTDYRSIDLSIGGIRLDAAAEIARRDQFQLSPINVEGAPWVQLDLIEWKTEKDRALHLCNESGFPLSRLVPGVVAPGFSFAAYLKSPYITQLNEDNLLDVAEMVPPLNASVEEARGKLRDHFRSRAAEKVKDLVQVWKSEHVYPYEEEPKSAVEQVQRQVFDVVAVSVATALPELQTSEQRTRRFQFRILRQAIERSPEDLQLIINEVLQLPQRKRVELAQLLQKTSLARIISAAKLVADRLEFLEALEAMLYRIELKAAFKERRQLHRILESNTWLFGEEFALTVSDRSLTEVLRKHRDACGMTNTLVDDEPVNRPDGSPKGRRRGIVDLVLSRRIPTPYQTELDHLVIELKAPKKLLAAEDTQQIRSYAYAVARDERFKGVETRWRFWLVSNDLSAYVEGELDNANMPHGVLQKTADGRSTITVRRWSELIQEAKGRLEFVQRELDYEVNRDHALERLRTDYAHILGDSDPVADVAPDETGDEEDEESDASSPRVSTKRLGFD